MVVDDVVFVGDTDDEAYSYNLQHLKDELEPLGFKIISMPSDYSTSEFDGFASAYGLYVNGVVTNNNLYLPEFYKGDTKHGETANFLKVLNLLHENVERNIIRVPIS